MYGTSVLGTRICKAGVHQWRVRVEQLCCRTQLGVAIDGLDTDEQLTCVAAGETFHWNMSQKVLEDGSMMVNYRYGEGLSVPATVTVCLDLDAGTLSFAVDGVDQGVAFTELKGKALRLVASSSDEKARLKLLSYSQVLPSLHAVPDASAAEVAAGTEVVGTAAQATPDSDSWDLIASSNNRARKVVNAPYDLAGDLYGKSVLGTRVCKAGVHQWQVRV